MTTDKLLLRVPEVAAMLGLSRSATYQLILTEQLPSFTIGRSRRIRLADVEAWVSAQTPPERSARHDARPDRRL